MATLDILALGGVAEQGGNRLLLQGGRRSWQQPDLAPQGHDERWLGLDSKSPGLLLAQLVQALD